jgi:hypothetical protein
VCSVFLQFQRSRRWRLLLLLACCSDLAGLVDNQHLTSCQLQSKLEFCFKTGKAWHALHELEKADSALTQATQLSIDLMGQTADADGGSSTLTTLADAHILHFFTLWKLQQWVRSSGAVLNGAALCTSANAA